MSDIVLSGIRATGNMHLGNLIGAVRNFVAQQEAGNECLYFIADWHTLTTLGEPEKLRTGVIEIAKDYLAAGLDPEKSTIYVQSSIPETAELSLLLGMLQPLGALLNINTYKELVRKHPDRVSHGLVSYPVMMAADILGPRATLVPVGADQKANIELARDLAEAFNRAYGDYFPVPSPIENMLKIPGLKGGKMGKSDAEDAIDIGAPLDEIAQAYKRFGVTDPKKVRMGDPGDPYNGCVSVYAVHEAITPEEEETRAIAKACMSGELGCGECKAKLMESMAPLLEPFQEARGYWAERDDEVREILIEGGRSIRGRITEARDHVADAMGIVHYV